MMMFQPNKPFYAVVADYGGPVLMETDIPVATMESAIELLRTGEHDRPLAVIEIDLSAGSSRDVSEDVARVWFERERSDWTDSSDIPAFIKANFSDAEEIISDRIHVGRYGHNSRALYRHEYASERIGPDRAGVMSIRRSL